MKVPTYDSRSSLREFHISLVGMQTKLAQADILFSVLGAAAILSAAVVELTL